MESGREAKSISEERTYGEDLTRPADIDRALLARADGVARELRREGLVARTVHLKVRTGDFETVTRSKTLSEPTDLAEVVLAAARELFRERVVLRGRGVRLLGVGVSGLEAAGAGQAALFGDERQEKLRNLARAADGIREKFGKAALARARLLPPRSAPGEDAEGARRTEPPRRRASRASTDRVRTARCGSGPGAENRAVANPETDLLERIRPHLEAARFDDRLRLVRHAGIPERQRPRSRRRRRSPALLRERFDLSRRLAEAAGRGVDLIDRRNADPIIAMQILRTGQPFLVHDAHALAVFRMTVPSLYFDRKLCRRPVEEAMWKAARP